MQGNDIQQTTNAQCNYCVASRVGCFVVWLCCFHFPFNTLGWLQPASVWWRCPAPLPFMSVPDYYDFVTSPTFKHIKHSMEKHMLNGTNTIIQQTANTWCRKNIQQTANTPCNYVFVSRAGYLLYDCGFPISHLTCWDNCSLHLSGGGVLHPCLSCLCPITTTSQHPKPSNKWSTQWKSTC